MSISSDISKESRDIKRVLYDNLNMLFEKLEKLQGELQKQGVYQIEECREGND